MAKRKRTPRWQEPVTETQCRGHRKDGERCRRAPIAGGTVCRWHGGEAPQVRAAAQKRIAAAKIKAKEEATIAQVGLLPVEDPVMELSKLASASMAMMNALGARVNALNDIVSTSFDGSDSAAVEVELYERAIDRTHKLFNSLIRAGFNEREIKLQEDQAMVIVAILDRVITQMGLKPFQQREARVLLADEFRKMEGGADGSLLESSGPNRPAQEEA